MPSRRSAPGRFTYAQSRDLVAEEMTPEQIAEAERPAGEWQPTQQPIAATWAEFF